MCKRNHPEINAQSSQFNPEITQEADKVRSRKSSGRHEEASKDIWEPDNGRIEKSNDDNRH
jgi:hypothetical protein